MSRLYVGHLSSDIRERDLEKFFRGYGRIREIVLKNGFGFVEIDDYRDADDAVHDLNGKELMGERVIVEHSKRPAPWMGGGSGGGYAMRGGPWGPGPWGPPGFGPPGPRPMWMDNSRYGRPQMTRYRLIVENLSTRYSWQDLKDLMREAGEVTYADAHRSRKNEGIVCFSSERDMLRAIDKFDGYEINGRKIKLVEDVRKRSRSRSASRSRTRSRSRSRSGHSRSKSKSPSRHSKSKSKTRRSRSSSRSGSDNDADQKKPRSPNQNGVNDSAERDRD